MEAYENEEADEKGKEDGPYLISALDSNYYDMKYVIIQDKSKIQQGMNQVSRNTLFLFVALLAGGAVLIWGLAHISYKPFLLMKKKVSTREEQLKNYFLPNVWEAFLRKKNRSWKMRRIVRCGCFR